MRFILNHFPLCPFSRKARLCLAEKRIEVELFELRPWTLEGAEREAFWALQPTGETPVLMVDDAPIGDSTAIVEFLEERDEGRRLMPDGSAARAEARRIAQLFDVFFFRRAVSVLLRERVMKKLKGQGEPDSTAIRAAAQEVRTQMKRMEALLERRRWLAGEEMTLADLAGAAHFSVLDYMGDAAWESSEAVKLWYSLMKSRPSFRSLLSDRIAGMPPSAHYRDPDF